MQILGGEVGNNDLILFNARYTVLCFEAHVCLLPEVSVGCLARWARLHLLVLISFCSGVPWYKFNLV